MERDIPYVRLTHEQFLTIAQVALHYLDSRSIVMCRLAGYSRRLFPKLQTAGIVTGACMAIQPDNPAIDIDEVRGQLRAIGIAIDSENGYVDLSTEVTQHLYAIAKRYKSHALSEDWRKLYKQVRFMLYAPNIPETLQQQQQNPYAQIAAATNRNIPYDYRK